MDSSYLEDHHINQEIHNLKDVEELDYDEEMLSPKELNFNAKPKPQQRNEDIEERMYFNL
jgi:hypothetical protein